MLIGQAITEYVALQSGDRTAWRISLSVPPQFVGLMQVKTNIVSIGGGQEPWEGTQEFVFEVKDRGALVSVPIKATLHLPPMIVTSKRAMRREEVITAESLTYSPIPQRGSADATDYFTDIAQLVGKQMRRSVTTGQPIESQFVGNAVVVTRGELVEVESVSGDVVVTTSGRASESGAVGELIGIELLPSRKRINASVTAPMKVRVSAVAARTLK
jgi:flagella basal body P-ring formation protein FlgA